MWYQYDGSKDKYVAMRDMDERLDDSCAVWHGSVDLCVELLEESMTADDFMEDDPHFGTIDTYNSLSERSKRDKDVMMIWCPHDDKEKVYLQVLSDEVVNRLIFEGIIYDEATER